jgi:branched-chain amino acid transport system permease protein
MPSATLLIQSLLSGLFTGALYALMGLGIGLTWGYLRLINLAQFALIFLGAYLFYQFTGVLGMPLIASLAIVLPLFFVIGVLLQLLFARFAVGEFPSLLVTFGIAIILEAAIQWYWTADIRRLDLGASQPSWRLGPFYLPVDELVMLLVAIALCAGTWAVLRFTYLGKAIRASAESPDIAAAFGVDHKKIALALSGLSAASAGVAGLFVALLFSFTPSQIFARMGVIFAVVMLGGLTNPLGLLAAGLAIGASEAVTMALTSPSWAPLVSFSLLILVLLLRPGRI